MNCEFCKRPIGDAGTQDYCVLCFRNLCDTCLARTHCEESTTFAHEPWSRQGEIKEAA